MNEKGEDLQAGFPATHSFPTGSRVLRESPALPHTVIGLFLDLPGYLLVPASSLVKWPMRYSIWQSETPALPAEVSSLGTPRSLHFWTTLACPQVSVHAQGTQNKNLGSAAGGSLQPSK